MAQKAEKKLFQQDGRDYYYWTLGDKKNPWVSIIPGFTGLHADLLPVARLLKQDYFVILPELPGWGVSSDLSTTMTITHYAEYLDALFSAIGDKQIILVGHCMGAVISLEYAYLFPKQIKKLFLVSTPYQDNTITKSVFTELVHMSMHLPRKLRPVAYLWRNRFFNVIGCFFMLQSRSLRKKARLIFRGVRLQSQERERSVEENWQSLMSFPFSRIQDIACPLYLIHGKKDLVIPLSQAEAFHDMVPHVSFDVIAQAGHLPPVETPKTLVQVLKKYL